MSIPVQQARAGLTQAILAKWSERVPVSLGLRSFATESRTNAKAVKVEVRRSGRPVAVDVLRGSDANMNRQSLSTERLYIPPYFNEGFTHTDLDYYDIAFGAGTQTADPGLVSDALGEIRDMYQKLEDKIERRFELQMSQLLQSGQVTLINGDTIDFKRKAESLLTNAAGDRWDAGTADIEAQLISDGNFLKRTGKSAGGTFNVLMGDDAALAFSQNEKLQKKLDIKNIDMGFVRQGIQNAAGLVPLGMVTAGNYRYILWGYGETYEHPTTGTETPYLDDNNIVVLPNDIDIKLAFAGVPTLRNVGLSGMSEVVSMRGGYVLDNYVDKKKAVHEFTIRAAAMPVPVTIDKMLRRKVLA